RLHFCWNPTLGDQSMPAETAWPGDEFVDSVGLDVYDVSWLADTYPWPAGAGADEGEARRTRAWDGILKASRGLEFWKGFAAEHRPAARAARSTRPRRAGRPACRRAPRPGLRPHPPARRAPASRPRGRPAPRRRRAAARAGRGPACPWTP